MKKHTLLSSLLAVLLFSGMSMAVDVYYDIDFSSPEHIVGLPPSVGSQPTRPSSIVFGSPTVQRSLGALNNQPLVFNTTGNAPSFYYDQIALNVAKAQQHYFVSFDMLTQNLVSSRNDFVVLFDTPTIRNLEFNNDGSIGIFGTRSGTIGSFRDNTLMHFEIDIDMIKQNWTISMNSNILCNWAFVPDNDIESIRFSEGLAIMNVPQDNSTYVGLDNIIVANAPIPEPTTILLFAVGGLALRKKRENKHSEII
jgi:hypothetical protein